MIRPRFTIGLSPDARLIREEVFMKEQGFVNEFDEHDEDAVCLVLYLEDTPIATGRLIKVDPATYNIGRVAVRLPYRGQQVGTYLLRFLCEKAREMGARTAIVHAQLDKRAFYERIGFREYGGGVIDEDEGVPHIYLAKDLRSKKRRYHSSKNKE